MTPAPLDAAQLEALLKQGPAQRAAWMLEDVAASEELWGLEDAQGWVVMKLAQPAPGRPAYAMPLWPRQELAALEAHGAGEQPRAIGLEELLEDLLPQVAEKGWDIITFSVKAEGQAWEPGELSAALADAWEQVEEEAP
jgi:hypothetical protein